MKLSVTTVLTQCKRCSANSFDSLILPTRFHPNYFKMEFDMWTDYLCLINLIQEHSNQPIHQSNPPINQSNQLISRKERALVRQF